MTQRPNNPITLLSLALRGLRFHWRSTLGVFLGAVLGAAILTGALAVGDSVRESLRQMALARLGNIHHVLVGNEKFFRAELVQEISAETKSNAAPLAFLRGTASLPDKGDQSVPVGRVQVVGMDERFGQFFPRMHVKTDDAILNQRLAERLNAKVGDEIVIRVEKPSLLSRDAPLSKVDDASVTIRLPIGAIVADNDGGRFSLEANQIPPLTVFLPIASVQNAISMPGRANVILLGEGVDPAQASQSLWKHWQFADAGLQLRTLPLTKQIELRTDRVFLDPPIADAAVKGDIGGQGVLTYFVNELRVGDKATPYSVVSALMPGKGVVPADMKDDEILLNQWLADDLGAKPGDTLKTTYWTVGALRKLEEHSQTFRVRGVVPITGNYADKELMPNIPGLSDKKNCREWEPGVPIELNKIRDKDEAYWSKYRGTPKAFITLHAGQDIWNNRFGNLTMVRYPLQGAGSEKSIEMCIRQSLNPGTLGLFFVPIREQALAASSQSMNLGLFFIGFSFFLIAAALILTALMFALGVEQRSEEVGTLLALGWSPKKVQRLLLFEGAAVAFLASVLGVLLATFYTRVVIAGLSGVWKGAVGSAALQYHSEPKTLVTGAVAAFLTALFSIWLVTRRQAKVPARELLASGVEHEQNPTPRKGKSSKRLPGVITGTVCLLLAVVIALTAPKGDAEKAAESFFSAGSLLLIGGIAFCRAILAKWERARSQALSLNNLGVRNTARRAGRSLSAIGLLACGSFLVIAIGASRKDANQNADRRGSGTGGFAFYAETALPVFNDLNTTDGQEQFGLDAEDVKGVQWVPMRVRAGDDASCLNLNRAQKPRILGVQSAAFKQRQAFTFGSLADDADKTNPWSVLDAPQKDGAIPVVGDANTVTWSLGKKLGDILVYPDERGNPHNLKIVGVLDNCILQGSLIMSEAHFTQMFPGQSGYSAFLIDAPKNSAPEISRTLARAMQDTGLTLSSAAERLADFNAVENTYLSIFAVLGGLGLLLGSVGLGVIVLRNVLERRGELALMRAVGFRANALYRLIFSEHLLLLLLGLLTGIVAAILAVLPALNTPDVPYRTLTLTLLAVLISGFVWVGLATGAALRGSLLPALRNE